MQIRTTLVRACYLALLFLPLSAPAATPSFNISDATPVGSWAEREQTMVDNKGRQSVAIMRQTLVDKVDHDGEPHYWVETESTNYKINKKGQRKQQGDNVIVKALVAKSALDGDPANVSNNLAGFGKEIIFQTGTGQPMRMREGGSMADFFMKTLGVKVNYQFDSAGKDTVETPAGRFDAEKFVGTGSVETRILIKTIKVESESEFWMTPEIPFGFARMSSRETVNGKLQTSEAVVTDFGMSGGVSRISGEPVDFMGDQGMGINFKDLMPGGRQPFPRRSVIGYAAF